MTQASISFSAGSADVSAVNDIDFLKAIEWERGADPDMRAAAASGNVSAFVAACQARTRNAAESPTTYAADILWSQAAFPDESELIPLLEEAVGVSSKPRKGPRRPANKTTRNFAQRVEALVYALTGEPQTVQTANAAYALAASLELLTYAGGRLRSQQYWRLWR